MDKVAIVGYNHVNPTMDLQMSPHECIFEAVRGALDKTGLKRHDLTTVVSCTNDYYDGKTISNCFKVECGGAYMKDESKVEMDGAYAAMYGMFRILSGNHKLAMIYGHSVPPEGFNSFFSSNETPLPFLAKPLKGSSIIIESSR